LGRRLLYVTAGLAYGQIDTPADLEAFNGNRFPASVSKVKAGWTAGAGAEWMLARNWSAKLEYLYLDLGNVSAFGAQIPAIPLVGIGYIWKMQDHIVRAGVNYHF
jgi:outer membrane immunogenic protein